MVPMHGILRNCLASARVIGQQNRSGWRGSMASYRAVIWYGSGSTRDVSVAALQPESHEFAAHYSRRHVVALSLGIYLINFLRLIRFLAKMIRPGTAGKVLEQTALRRV